MSGWFDCRKYQAGKERAQRDLLADTDVITFSTSFTIEELPGCFRDAKNYDYVSFYSSKDAPQGEKDRAAVNLKISKSCKWYDKFGKACARPSNTELDMMLSDGRFEVMIDFATLTPEASAGPLAPRGFWANSIMYQKAETNPFLGNAFAADTEQAVQSTTKAEQAVTEQPQGTDDLPF